MERGHRGDQQRGARSSVERSHRFAIWGAGGLLAPKKKNGGVFRGMDEGGGRPANVAAWKGRDNTTCVAASPDGGGRDMQPAGVGGRQEEEDGREKEDACLLFFSGEKKMHVNPISSLYNAFFKATYK